MRSPIGMPIDSGAPRCGQWSSSMTGRPASSRHSTTLSPRRRSEIGFSPRKCDGQIGYQMLRTPLVSRLPIDWLVTAVIVLSLLGAKPLHFAAEQLVAPRLAVG